MKVATWVWERKVYQYFWGAGRENAAAEQNEEFALWSALDGAWDPPLDGELDQEVDLLEDAGVGLPVEGEAGRRDKGGFYLVHGRRELVDDGQEQLEVLREFWGHCLQVGGGGLHLKGAFSPEYLGDCFL